MCAFVHVYEATVYHMCPTQSLWATCSFGNVIKYVYIFKEEFYYIYNIHKLNVLNILYMAQDNSSPLSVAQASPKVGLPWSIISIITYHLYNCNGQ